MFASLARSIVGQQLALRLLSKSTDASWLLAKYAFWLSLYIQPTLDKQDGLGFKKASDLERTPAYQNLVYSKSPW